MVKNNTRSDRAPQRGAGRGQAEKVLLPAALALLTFLAFSPVIQNDFVNYDDNKLITMNPLVINGNETPVRDLFLKNLHNPHYKPLVLLCWNIEYRLFGLDSRIFHLNNLLLHIGNVLLVYWIGIRFVEMLLAKRSLRTWHGQLMHYRLPFLVALLFSLHPLHVETVAWASERKDLLYALFFLSSILVYLYYLETRKPAWILLSAFFYLLVIGTKSMGITLPAVLFLLDGIFGRKVSWRNLFEKMLHMAILIAAVYLYGLAGSFNVYATGLTAGIVNQGFGSYPDHLSGLPAGYLRLLIISTRIMLWIQHILIPMPLSPLYSEDIFLDRLGYRIHLCVALLLVMMLMMLIFRKKVPILVAGSLFFLITLSPALSIAERGMGVFVPDRYTYLPLMGILVPPVIHAYLYIHMKRRLRPAAYMTVFAIIIFYGVSSNRLCTRWHDSETLWSYVLGIYPEEDAAWNARGMFYNDQGDTIRALHDFNRAVAIDPACYWAYNSRAKIYARKGLLDSALRDFLLITRVDPWFTEAFTNLGAVYGLKGQYELSLKALNRAHALKPSDPDVLLNRGVTYLNMNDYERCIIDLNRYLTLKPGNAEVINSVGVCYLRLGQLDRAELEFNRALSLKPDFDVCRNNLALCYRKEKGERREEK
jgi:Flp pilus assembly protein TadD